MEIKAMDANQDDSMLVSGFFHIEDAGLLLFQDAGLGTTVKSLFFEKLKMAVLSYGGTLSDVYLGGKHESSMVFAKYDSAG